MEQEYLSVSALSRYIQAKFTRDPYLREVYVTGEISNVTIREKMAYFHLKEGTEVISAVLFAKKMAKLGFQLEEGQKVNVIAEVTTYSGQSRYQLIVKKMTPDGVGNLFLALQQLKEELSKEGLFDEKRKKKIPKYPKKIAVITSPTGAVIRDILTTVKRRYPIAQIVLFPTVVQGSEAVNSLVENIQKADALSAFDTMIVGRGGGSVEDLWCFNDERVVRAIFEAKTPIISSVGHETDTTLTDFVADIRAATPTAASELATPVLVDEIGQIRSLQNRLFTTFKGIVKRERVKVDYFKQSYVLVSPERLYLPYIQQVNLLTEKLKGNTQHVFREKCGNYEAIRSKLLPHNPKNDVEKNRLLYEKIKEKLPLISERILKENEQKFLNLLENLDLLSPTKTLLRGFSVTRQKGKIVRSIKDVTREETLEVEVCDGKIQAKIMKIMEKKHDENSENI